LRLNNLVRRTRTLARRSETLVAGMYITGCFYNFCDYHHGLRLKLSVGSFHHHWVQRTPAIAAKLTDHNGLIQNYSLSKCLRLVGAHLFSAAGLLRL